MFRYGSIGFSGSVAYLKAEIRDFEGNEREIRDCNYERDTGWGRILQNLILKNRDSRSQETKMYKENQAVILVNVGNSRTVT